MSIFRKNMITNDWVIFAPNRAKKPVELKSSDVDNIKILSERPEIKEGCPFCPGYEKPEDVCVLEIRRNGRWQVKVLENRYSSVDRYALPDKRSTMLRKEMDGFGVHDVIVDHPRHNINLALMSMDDLEILVRAWLERYRQLTDNPLIEHVVLFKNQGIRAGGSLEHPHSQIYGIPIVPFETRVRLREAERYYDLNDRCLMCDILKDELNEKSRIFYENSFFVGIVPYADLSPYHFWIVPRTHHASFSQLSEPEVPALAEALSRAMKAMYGLLRNPDYNMVFQSLARYEHKDGYYHWYISVIPQVKHKGGLEYAGGLFVNPVMPETAAMELKEVLDKVE